MGVTEQQLKRQQREQIKAIKHKVFQLELENRECLYLYRYSEDWWRMGGNSALFYYHIISKQLNTHPSLSLDRDYYDTWKTGVINVRNIEQLLEKFVRAGYKIRKESNFAVVTLQKKFTTSEVKAIQNIEAAKEKEFNRLTVPRLLYPGISAKLRELTEPLIETLVKLNSTRYNLYGHEGAEICWKLKREFISMVNGRTDAMKYFNEAIELLDNLSDWLAAVRDYHIFNNDTNLRHANNIINLRRRMAKELSTLKNNKKAGAKKEQRSLFDKNA